MAKSKRIKSNKRAGKNIVPPKEVPQPRGISFSFLHVHFNHRKFSFSNCTLAYFEKLLDRLKSPGSWSATSLQASRSPSIRCHPIRWNETTEPDGFTHLNEQLRSCTPYQFAVSVNEHGRVHGFFLKDIFYVVWLDPKHDLRD